MNPVAAVLGTVTTVLQIINSAEPDIAAIISLFRSSSLTLEQYLTDATNTENANIAKLKAAIK